VQELLELPLERCDIGRGEPDWTLAGRTDDEVNLLAMGLASESVGAIQSGLAGADNDCALASVDGV
jgi:hypothetical protein